MATRWSVMCKNCGGSLEYADHVYAKKQTQQGYSRPEYCDKCRLGIRRRKQGMGAPHFARTMFRKRFNALLVKGVSIFRDVRKHNCEVNTPQFNMSEYGLKEEQVRNVFEWLNHPEHQVAIVVAPTGAGKSTAFPYCLAFPFESLPQDLFTRVGPIVISQPRIDAATGIAKYQAVLAGGVIGRNGEIGVRHSESKDTAGFDNIILYATEGSIKNWLCQNDLSKIGTIIIDEAHERSCNIDIMLTLLRDALTEYPHLKVIITSATIDPKSFQNFFGSHTAAIIELSGEVRKYKVHELFATEANILPYDDVAKLSKMIAESACNKTQEVLNKIHNDALPKGHILVFLPGVASIESSVEIMTAFVQANQSRFGKVKIFCWHSKISETERNKATKKESPDDVLKVIFATNIGETSITVDYLVHIIDSGLINQSSWDKLAQKDRVIAILHSQSGCRQRWGRGGRTSVGYAHCLYTREQFEQFPQYTIPEIQRSNLYDIARQLQSTNGISSEESAWLALPDTEEMTQSLDKLSHQGFFDGDGDTTAQGDSLMKFAEFEDIGALIIAAVQCGCVVELASVLPVLKIDGVRDILEWDVSWDICQRRIISNRQASLMSGCVDDIDFVLRLVVLFDGIDKEAWRVFSLENGIRYSSIKKIFEERDNVLSKLQSGMKNLDLEDIRTPDIHLADVIRFLFAYYIPSYRSFGVIYSKDADAYVYREDWTHDDEVVYPFRIAFPEAWIQEVEKIEKMSYTMNAISLFTGSLKSIDERAVKEETFVWKNYPIGKQLFVKERNHSQAPVVLFEYTGEAYEKIQFQGQLISVDVSKRGHFVAEEEMREVAVTGYVFVKDAPPVIVTRFVSAKDSFKKFCQQHRRGDQETFQVIERIVYASTESAAFVLRHEATGAEALIEAEDLMFSPSGVAMMSIPIGTRMTMDVLEVDESHEYIRVSYLSIAEKNIQECMQSWSLNGRTSLQKGKLIDMRSKGHSIVLLDQSRTEEGFLFTVEVWRNAFKQPDYPYCVGEDCVVLVYHQNNRPASGIIEYSSSKSVSVNVMKLLEGVSLEGNNLAFDGKISYQILDQLKQNFRGLLASDQVLDNLYRETHRLSAQNILSVAWIQKLKAEYSVDSIVTNAIVNGVRNNGAYITLREGVSGFVHCQAMYGRIDNGKVGDVLAEGDSVSVRVLFISDDGFVRLSMKVKGNHNPYQSLVLNSIVSGQVIEVRDKSFFVEIAPFVKGQVPSKNMWGRPTDIQSLVKVGARVQVKIISIDEDRDTVELSAKLSDSNPYTWYSVGEAITGKVTNIRKNYGWDIEIPGGASGLVLVRSCTGYIKNLEDVANIGDRVKVHILHIDAATEQLDLKFV